MLCEILDIDLCQIIYNIKPYLFMKIEKKSFKKSVIIASMVVVAMTAGDSIFNEVQATSTFGNCGGAPYNKKFNYPYTPNDCFGSGNSCKVCKP
jgi:hypothetical protein